MVEKRIIARITGLCWFDQLQLLLFNLLVGLVPGTQHPSHHGVSDGAAALLDFCWPPEGAAVRRIRGICQREFTVARPSSNLLSQFLHCCFPSFQPQLGIHIIGLLGCCLSFSLSLAFLCCGTLFITNFARILPQIFKFCRLSHNAMPDGYSTVVLKVD